MVPRIRPELLRYTFCLGCPCRNALVCICYAYIGTTYLAPNINDSREIGFSGQGIYFGSFGSFTSANLADHKRVFSFSSHVGNPTIYSLKCNQKA